MNLYFVTGNQDKFDQLKEWLQVLAPQITLIQENYDLPECQSLDVTEVATKKAEDAWKRLKKPLIIDDGGVYFADYPQFPGTFTKFMFKCLRHAGLWKIVKDNPRGWFNHCLAFAHNEGIELFMGTTHGTFIEHPRGGSNQDIFQISRIFIPEGSDKTYAELEETPKVIEIHKQYHSRYEALEKLLQWLRENPQ